jgi:Domain of unknown function (DUF5658)
MQSPDAPFVRSTDHLVIDLRDSHSTVAEPTRGTITAPSPLTALLRRARITAAVLLVVLNIADLITTKMFLDRGLQEGNALSALLLSTGTMPLAKSAILFGLMWSAVRSAPKVATTCAMWFVVGLYTTVIGVNLLAIAQLG